jgi:hypothetical protein
MNLYIILCRLKGGKFAVGAVIAETPAHAQGFFFGNLRLKGEETEFHRRSTIQLDVELDPESNTEGMVWLYVSKGKVIFL